MGLLSFIKKSEKNETEEQPVGFKNQKDTGEEKEPDSYIALEEYQELCEKGLIKAESTVGDFKLATMEGATIDSSQLNQFNDRIEAVINGQRIEANSERVCGVVVTPEGVRQILCEALGGNEEGHANEQEDNMADESVNPPVELGENDVDFANISNVLVNADIADIRFEISQRTEEYVGSVSIENQLSEGSAETKFYVKDDTLVIEENKSSEQTTGSYVITIYIVNCLFNHMAVHTTSGNISYHAYGSGFYEGDFQTMSGNIDIEFSASGITDDIASFKDLKLSSRSGDIKCSIEYNGEDKGYIYQRVIVDNQSGNITINNTATYKMDCSTMSGDIKVDSHVIEFAANSMSGNVEAFQRLFDNGKANISTISGFIYYYPINIKELRLSGSDNIDQSSFEPDKDGFEADVNLTSNTGEITVEHHI